MKTRAFSLLTPLFLLNPISDSQTLKLESIVQQVQQSQPQAATQTPADSSLSSLTRRLKERGFDIDTLLDDKRFEIYQNIASYFKNSSENRAQNLDEYKKIHKFEERKDSIAKFIERNLASLIKAEKTYGVSKEIIAAIFGIESGFAKGVGKFSPFNVYVSMILKNSRAEFALGQLEELLKFCRKNSINVFDLKSSYAGAMSYAQFIPSSLNRWFVGSDIYDMNNNIMSVANYLSDFKKRTGSLEKSIYRYNNHPFYVGFVMELAKEAEKALASPQ